MTLSDSKLKLHVSLNASMDLQTFVSDFWCTSVFLSIFRYAFDIPYFMECMYYNVTDALQLRGGGGGGVDNDDDGLSG